MDSFNPVRLDLARRRRGLTKGQLAARAELTTRSLNMYERGEIEPTAETVKRLARALGFPDAFLMRPDTDEPLAEAVSFRARSAMTIRQQNQALSAAAIAIELVDWIEQRFALPLSSIPRLHDVDPESAADQLRAEWGLGERRIGNMVHLLEQHGARVFSLAEENEDIDAFSFWRDGVPYVFLNSMKSAERSRMDAAHELGHLVMHFWADGPNGHSPTGRQAEAEAQAFGGAFLMPRRSILADAPRGPSVAHIVHAKRRWNVAAMALAYRMRGLDILTEWQARKVYTEMTRRGYRRAEPDEIERERSQVLAKVFATLRGEGITQVDIADELAIPQAELQKLVFGLVLSTAPPRGRGAEAPSNAGSARAQLTVVPD
jgi:Zn-dependent peptidase ImmA (M78 family)/DNA-binding XRE family transcriptional regulator